MTEAVSYRSAISVPQSVNPLNTRAALLAVCAAVWASVVLMYAQGAWLSIVMLLLTDGLLAGLLVLAATALGNLVLRAMKVNATGALRLATAAGIGLGAFSLVTLGLGLLGLLSQITAIAMPVISVAAWYAVVGRHTLDLKGDVSGHLQTWLRQPAGWHWLFVVAMPALAVATVGVSIVPGFLWKPDDPHPYDVVSYHLQVPREWYELGRIVPLTHNAFSYFPFNVEMQFLLSMHLRGGPWAGMYLAQFMSFAFGVLAVLATYGMARTIAGRPGATIAAVAVATVPWTAMVSSVAYVEMALIFYAALAVGWMVNAIFVRDGQLSLTWDGHSCLSLPPDSSSCQTQKPGGEKGRNACPTEERESRGETQTGMSVPRGEGVAPCTIWRNAVIAGLCGGLACGVKLTAGPMLLGPLAVAMIVVSFRGQLKRAVVAGAIFVVIGLLVVSPWLVRNAVWAGNPFFPNATGVFGAAHWLPGQVERYAAAHSPGMTRGIDGAMIAPFEQIVFHWQYGFVILPLALFGLAMMGRWKRIAIAMVLVLAAQLAFWTNTHMIGRFMLVGLPMVALLVAMVDRHRITRLIASIAVVGGALVSWIGLPATGGGLNARLEHFAAIGRQGLFGLEDISFIQLFELQDILKAGGVVHFVGDAQTFRQQAKTAQTRYRTVFDVRPDTEDPIEAWTGKPLSALPADEWVLIDPAEIARLSKTYRHVPEVPASYPGPPDRPYLMNGAGRVIVPAR